MGFFSGIAFNIRGLRLAIKTPKLLWLGLIRILATIILTFVAVSFLLVYHQAIMSLLWTKPASMWILWIWYLLSWILTLLLITLSTFLSYLVAQMLFAVVIMDIMSRITERIVTGEVTEPEKTSLLKQLGYLMTQEIPRAVIPVLLSLALMVLSWFTPAGPLITFFSSLVAAVFLAWDNTDIPLARQLIPFNIRYRFLLKNLRFHLGFGICFLVPLINILLLSYAPVGATLYQIEQTRKAKPASH